MPVSDRHALSVRFVRAEEATFSSSRSRSQRACAASPGEAFQFDWSEEGLVTGGACVNDVLFHVAHEGLPFGGVGPSGIGRYHGFDGFVTFSHQKSVLYQSRWSVQSLIRPPYGPRLERVMQLALRWL